MKHLSPAAALVWALVSLAACEVKPIQMSWSSQTFGPDGPWQGVDVVVGQANPPDVDGDSVTVYPGGSWDAVIFTNAVCNGSTSACLASEAGLYNPGNSQTANYDVQFEPDLGVWGSDVAMNITGERQMILDTLTIHSPGLSYSIPQFVFAAVNSSNAMLPNGNYYPSQVGLLTLGAPNPEQSFGQNNGSSIIGNMLTGYLKRNGSISSSSWGLHIGSVVQGQPGSLTLGGFDKSRVLGQGTAASFDFVGEGGSTPIVSLIDITMGVETGGSPFNSSSVEDGLFRFDRNTSASVTLNPAVPYMFLPAATCDAIAQYLPVTYQSSSGLYTWNKNDPQYLRIVSSPAYLQFTFQQSIGQNVSIKVPFALLNLTLETPILNSPQPYFPCKPYYTPDGGYYLGRAFLQAAFLGVNYDQGKFFVGQAPGPDSGPIQITTIQTSDATIRSNPIDTFADSWNRKWTTIALPKNSTSDNTSGGIDGPTNTPATLDPGLSTGAKAGIGIGIAAVVLILLGILLGCIIMRRKRRKQQPAQALPSPPPPPPVGGYYNDKKPEHPVPPYSQRHHAIHELDAPNVVHETGDGSLPEMSANRDSRVMS
ncbi:MAG: hypothetical protein Q9187_004517 [Circinaria calcarea]